MKGSTVALTVTPDVSVYRYQFNHVTYYAAVNLLLGEVENSNVTWSDSKFAYLDSRTVQVTLSDGGRYRCYIYVKFSRSAARHGTFSSHDVTAGATSITGDNVGGYLAFLSGAPVTVAVALSMTSMARAERNGFPGIEGCVRTSFLPAGGAVARYFARRVANCS